ncbi:MAG: calcium-binding protein [Alphaproteobacteria bacterium]|nr:calcium-binding protein [Alphaproteobacteria bacterium]
MTDTKGITRIGERDATDILVGSDYDDHLIGGGGDDVLFGGAGDDRLEGGFAQIPIFEGSPILNFSDDDWLMGGEGDDELLGGLGTNRLIGGEGHDTAKYNIASLDGVEAELYIDWTGQLKGKVYGANEDNENIFVDDRLTSIEQIDGSFRNDTLTSFVEDTKLNGGLGDDTIIAGVGVSADGERGEDSLILELTSDQAQSMSNAELEAMSVYRDNPDDTHFDQAGLDMQGFESVTVKIDGVSVDQFFLGSKGSDTMDGGPQSSITDDGDGVLAIGRGGDDDLVGGDAADVLIGGKGQDTLTGGAGDDVLIGGDNRDVIDGGAGDDTLNAGTGWDSVYGGDGDDTLIVEDKVREQETFDGGAGDDTLKAGSDGDETLAVRHFDSTDDGNVVGIEKLEAAGIVGDQSDNVIDLSGIASVDLGKDGLISGGKGADTITGNQDANTIAGGNGNDVLNGGGGNDQLTGGTGKDIFVFESGFQSDTVMDFKRSSNDKLDFTAFEIDSLMELKEAANVEYEIVPGVGFGTKITFNDSEDSVFLANYFFLDDDDFVSMSVG